MTRRTTYLWAQFRLRSVWVIVSTLVVSACVVSTEEGRPLTTFVPDLPPSTTVREEPPATTIATRPTIPPLKISPVTFDVEPVDFVARVGPLEPPVPSEFEWSTFAADTDVREIAVADDGTIWGVSGLGVVRYEPSSGTATTFTALDGVGSDYVFDVDLGPDGSVWVGTAVGLARYHDGSWTSYTPIGSDAPVRRLVVGDDATVWFSSGSKLGVFDGHAWRVGGSGEGEAAAIELAVDADYVWATFEEDLLRIDRDTLDAVRMVHARMTLVHVTEASDGGVWVASERTVARIDGSSWSAEQVPAPPTSWIQAMFEIQGDLWVIGYREQTSESSAMAAIFREGEWQEYELPQDREWGWWPTSAMQMDADGAIWAAHPQGLLWIHGGESSMVPMADLYSWELPSRPMAISAGSDGSLWIRLEDELWVVRDDEARREAAIPESSDWNMSLDVADDGGVWLGSDERLLLYDGAVWHEYAGGGDLPEWFGFDTVVAAPDGTIWSADPCCPPVVVRFDGDRFTTRTDGLTLASVERLLVDTDSSVWAVGGGGSMRYDGERWVPVGSAAGASVAAVGDDGAIWVAGSEGLVRVDDEQGESFGPPETGAQDVTALGIGPDGTAWVAIYEWPAERARIFTLREGVWTECTSPWGGPEFIMAIEVSPTGGVWLLHFDGVTRLTPSK